MKVKMKGQNVEFNRINHCTKLETNWFINVWLQANIFLRSQLFPLLPILSLKTIIWVCNSNYFHTTANFILMCWKACKKMMPTNFALCWPCDPQSRLRLLKVVLNGRNQQCLHTWQVLKNLVEKFVCHIQHWSFCYARWPAEWTQLITQIHTLLIRIKTSNS